MVFRKHCFFALTLLSVVVAAAFACEPFEDTDVEVAGNTTGVVRNAVANCSEEQFHCDGATASGGLCIPLAWKCDGEADCEDETDEPTTCPKGRMARSPKKKSTKKPKEPKSGGDGKHHVPCSVTCTNGGHIPTCCDAHGLSGGKCVGEKGYCN